MFASKGACTLRCGSLALPLISFDETLLARLTLQNSDNTVSTLDVRDDADAVTLMHGSTIARQLRDIAYMDLI